MPTKVLPHPGAQTCLPRGPATARGRAKRPYENESLWGPDPEAPARGLTEGPWPSLRSQVLPLKVVHMIKIYAHLPVTHERHELT